MRASNVQGRKVRQADGHEEAQDRGREEENNTRDTELAAHRASRGGRRGTSRG